MQHIFFDPEQQNYLPGVSFCLPPPAEKLLCKPSAILSSSYLYLRGSLYYFRYKFPRPIQMQLGHAEIRISLRTGHMRWAKYLSAQLYTRLQLLISGDILPSYSEICRRMNILMQQLLESELQKIGRFVEIDNKSKVSESAVIRTVLLPMLDGIKALFPSIKQPRLSREETAALGTKMFGSSEQMADLEKSLIPNLLQRGIFREDELDEHNQGLVTQCFLEMQNECIFLLRERELGNYQPLRDALAQNHGPIYNDDDVQANTPATESVTPQQETSYAPCPPETNTQAMLYSVAMGKYSDNKLIEGRWKKKSLPDNVHRLENFITIIGDKPIDQINREDMRSFRDTLLQLPPNYARTETYAGMSIKEILDSKPVKTLHPNTVNTSVQAVASMLEWLVVEGHLQSNPGKRLQIADNRQEIDLKPPFTAEELKQIFAHPKFSKGKFKFASYFWPPLISLFTGMRLEEICQLHCADIYRLDNDDLWVIDANEKGQDELGIEKTLKTKNSPRLIPIHSQLIDLGLLDYHTKLMSCGHIRMFPDLKLTEKVTDFGKQAGKQFKGVVSDSLADSAGKSFSSLRHTFSNFYKQRGLQNSFFDQIFAHKQATLAARRYGGKFPPRLLYDEIISKLDYGMDLSKLKEASMAYYNRLAANR